MHSIGKVHYWRLRPFTAADIADLRGYLAAIGSALAPARAFEVAKVFALLRGRYQSSFAWARLSDEQLEGLTVEWVEDLQEYPIRLIEEAYRLWRHGHRPGQRARSKGEPPRDAGELMSVVKPVLTDLRTTQKQINSALSVMDTPKNKQKGAA